MRYVAAYMLAALSAKTPSAKSIKAILDSAGVDIEADKIDSVLKAMDGKNIAEVVEEGLEKLTTVPTGGAAAAPAAATSSEQASSSAPAKKEEEENDESDDDMGFGLFD
ncbi:DgyrCDS9642 [Dimorphilus gyrociliatus]|nr:DgyrCDS9642 [Dimorphilus gyrociliatus]